MCSIGFSHGSDHAAAAASVVACMPIVFILRIVSHLLSPTHRIFIYAFIDSCIPRRRYVPHNNACASHGHVSL